MANTLVVAYEQISEYLEGDFHLTERWFDLFNPQLSPWAQDISNIWRVRADKLIHGWKWVQKHSVSWFKKAFPSIRHEEPWFL